MFHSHGQDIINTTEIERRITISEVNAAISVRLFVPLPHRSFSSIYQGDTKVALAQLSKSRRGAAATTCSSDPRLRAHEFQELRETWAVRALENMRLQTKTETPLQLPIETSPEWLQLYTPLPPTPPRRSQKLLGGDSNQSGDGHHEPPVTDGAEWREDMIGRGTNRGEEQDEEATAGEGSLGDNSEDTQGEDSPGSKRVYTQEELVILTRRIFGDDEEEEDATWWDDVDGAPNATIDHPGKQEVSHTVPVDQQGEESDIGEESGEGGGVQVTRLFGDIFGPSSSTRPSKELERRHPRAHEHAEVVQDVLKPAVHSATGGKSPENDKPRITVTPTLTASPECHCAPLSSSTHAQRTSLRPGSSFGIYSSKAATPVRDPKPEISLKVDVIVDKSLFGIIPLPAATQVTPPELEPRKRPVATTRDELLQCNTTSRMDRRNGLPEFSPTRPGLFSMPIHKNVPTRKRKRNCEDDEDGEMASNLCDELSSREVLLPR